MENYSRTIHTFQTVGEGFVPARLRNKLAKEPTTVAVPSSGSSTAGSTTSEDSRAASLAESQDTNNHISPLSLQSSQFRAAPIRQTPGWHAPFPFILMLVSCAGLCTSELARALEHSPILIFLVSLLLNMAVLVLALKSSGVFQHIPLNGREKIHISPYRHRRPLLWPSLLIRILAIELTFSAGLCSFYLEQSIPAVFTSSLFKVALNAAVLAFAHSLVTHVAYEFPRRRHALTQSVPYAYAGRTSWNHDASVLRTCVERLRTLADELEDYGEEERGMLAASLLCMLDCTHELVSAACEE
ncbi:hypothetical protein K488DRAFT_81471 [Vararia minispora EC-137]|uniref:Uncharacterized protein n=1 Tax=Vararia minispora EC-137 TaxID=1314806 RepID=A0ACB8R0U4_9AGAM|nr:hypothetical protein K488DRAFT_81471 [Vararia minispora EC-137]